MDPRYLGDSVYIEESGAGRLAIYQDNGYGPHAVTYLELEVMLALEKYIKEYKLERVSSKYKKYLDYIQRAGGRAKVEWFDNDWEPIGPTVRREMESEGLIKIVDDVIKLENGIGD